MPATVLHDSEDDEDDLLQSQSSPVRERLERDNLMHHCAESSEHADDKMPHAEPHIPASTTASTSLRDIAKHKSSATSLKRRHTDMQPGCHYDDESGADTKRARLARTVTASHVNAEMLDEIVVSERRSARHCPSGPRVTEQRIACPASQAMFADSGDTVAYTEQTQQLINDQLAIHNQKSYSNSRRLPSSSNTSSFPWTAHDSPGTAEQNDPTDPAHTHALKRIVSQITSIPDEAHHLIEQYLEDNNVSGTTGILDQKSALQPAPSYVNSGAMLNRGAGQAYQEEQTQPSAKCSHTDRRTSSRLDRRELTSSSVGGGPVDTAQPESTTVPTTIDPAMLQIDKGEPNTDRGPASTGDEIIVAAPTAKHKRNHSGPDNTASPISIESIVQLLRDKPTTADHPPERVSTRHSIAASLAQSQDPPSKLTRAKKTTKKKTKRCYTTIFEDHVELQQNQTSLTLSQQQAQRKAALDVVHDGSNRLGSERARHKSVLDDTEQKSSEELESVREVDDSNTPLQDLTTANNHEVTSPTAVPASKHGDSVKSDASFDVTGAMRIEEAVAAHSQTNTVHSASQFSPSRPVQGKLLERGIPTTHSPIKTSTTISFRVGLSKRQRIPSLLRVVRPSRHA